MKPATAQRTMSEHLRAIREAGGGPISSHTARAAIKAGDLPLPHICGCGRMVFDDEALAAGVKHFGRKRLGTTEPRNTPQRGELRGVEILTLVNEEQR
jgi:hypothetical protein